VGQSLRKRHRKRDDSLRFRPVGRGRITIARDGGRGRVAVSVAVSVAVNGSSTGRQRVVSVVVSVAVNGSSTGRQRVVNGSSTGQRPVIFNVKVIEIITARVRVELRAVFR
jgi:hypothetical protein